MYVKPSVKEDDMTTKPIDQTGEPVEDRNAMLEKALIEEYLHEKGYSHEDLKTLPADVLEILMKEASRYASLKMEEVSARARFIKGLHDDSSSLEK
jgi:hypothetical protein